ncbi:hypothetical protein JR316_0010002 [Psilocybe cubensis]|uniref:F-box domain-containing protein n=2 Tax=Psilocybe cubensis TaxID=181762 RepID=A0A8H7XPV1_PSICU|nr:hypothetical protein JR316_0010002 [Psilocybe cubensis]KAH9477773.1 hypothetical protein JR316_0010002 [Psilocybe cubensis]
MPQLHEILDPAIDVAFSIPGSAFFDNDNDIDESQQHSYRIPRDLHHCNYAFEPLSIPTTYKPPRHDTLPFDVKEIILNLIDSPRDFASLALTSRDWASTIIPDYLYRELSIPINHSTIWKVFAERPHLAKCTHTLRLLEPARNKSGAPLEVSGPSEDTLRNMSLALEGFTSLRKFCWAGSRSTLQIDQSFLQALARCPALEELDLGPVSLQSDHQLPSLSSLWRFPCLTKLILKGDWDLTGVDFLYLSLINNSPNLEELSILFGPASSHFTSCPLPKLRKLHLWHDSLYIQFPESELYPFDVQILNFLRNHPNIEDLRWLTWSWNRLTFPSGFLPSLKRLRAYGHLYRSLLQDPTLIDTRKWECISRATLTADMPILEQLDLSCLKEMRLLNFEGFDSLKQLAEIAPSITTLAIPSFGPPMNINCGTHSTPPGRIPSMVELDLENYIDCLAHFPSLETLLDTRLWSAILRLSTEERSEAVTQLTSRCRSLSRLNYWDRLRHAEMDIIFSKCEDGRVSWREEPSQEENWERFGGL